MLGPVLFLDYISDIDASTESVVSCLADNTRAMRAVDGPGDVSALQGDLEEIYRGAKDNNMSFNDDKYQVLNHSNISGIKTLHQYASPDQEGEQAKGL